VIVYQRSPDEAQQTPAIKTDLVADSIPIPIEFNKISREPVLLSDRSETNSRHDDYKFPASE
jgi:hypothetical protein